MPFMPTTIALCLACSASLPPRKADTNVFHTICCSRPICPNCLSTNPRLARYNPCLRCLAGVKAVSSQLSGAPPEVNGGKTNLRPNIDGSIRDEDIFVVEDEDNSDQDDTDSEEGHARAVGKERAPDGSTYRTEDGNTHDDCLPKTSRPPSPRTEEHPQAPGMPYKYFIRPDDTLLGISFKLGIDSRILCRLNNLPASTMRTTPHLLHTRSSLILPPSAHPPLPPTPAELALDEERRARLAIERAETRFQSMTKETDRDVAKAYVALAGLPDSADSKEYVKEKENESWLRKRRVRSPGDGPGESSLEGRAMDQYFDDADWESREREEGRKVAITSFPYLSKPSGSDRVAGNAPTRDEQKPWWRWTS